MRLLVYIHDFFDSLKFPIKLIKHPQLKEWLPMLAERYQALADFSLEECERVARELADEVDTKPGVIINGMRTVVTGQLAGPSMFDILLALGRDRVVQRLKEVAKLYPEG